MKKCKGIALFKWGLVVTRCNPLINSHPYQSYFRFYHWYVPIATVNALGCMLFSCQTRFMRQGVLRKLLRVMAFAIPYCFDSVPLLYRSVSPTALTVCPSVQVSISYCFDSVPLLCRSVSSTASIVFPTAWAVCPYRTGHYPPLLRQCALIVQVSIPSCFDSVPLLYKSVSSTASTVCPYCTGQYTFLL